MNQKTNFLICFDSHNLISFILWPWNSFQPNDLKEWFVQLLSLFFNSETKSDLKDIEMIIKFSNLGSIQNVFYDKINYSQIPRSYLSIIIHLTASSIATNDKHLVIQRRRTRCVIIIIDIKCEVYIVVNFSLNFWLILISKRITGLNKAYRWVQ